ncbi:CapA family protein [Nakamurella sp. GG22]
MTIAVSGDVLLHTQLIEQARQDAAGNASSTVDGMDFFPMLADQQRYGQSADIGICHLETPLADPGGPFENYPEFSVSPQVLPALTKTEYDACSTASNHTIDQGTDGLDRTLDDLDAAGLIHDGSYRTRAGSKVPVVINTENGRVGFISVAYGFNGNEPDEPWQVNTIDVDAIKAKARSARLADPDIDLVYGHHAHVVQPMEKINGGWAIYGLGNNIAAQLGSAPGMQQGLLVRVQFSQDTKGEWTTTDVAWVASYQDVGAPYRWCALTPTDTCGTGDGTALAETTAVVNQWGADTDGAHRIN